MPNDFTNKGVIVAHDGSIYAKPRAFCVCGIARSGTTSVASGLEAAGVSMGSNLSNVKEDQEFRRVIEEQNPAKFESYIRQRVADRNHPTGLPIGFKFPDAYRSIEQIAQTDGLCIIVTTRDLLAIASRNAESVFQPVDVGLDEAIKGMRNLYQKVQSAKKQNCKARIIFVSYEKILTSPQRTFETIFILSGIMPDEAKCLAEKASHGISKEPQAYRAESNLQPEYAIDDSNTQGVISGWCYFRSQPDKKVILQLRLENCVVGTAECNLPREDLDGKRRGFEFDLTTLNLADSSHDELEIFLGDSSFTLT